MLPEIDNNCIVTAAALAGTRCKQDRGLMLNMLLLFRYKLHDEG